MNNRQHSTTTIPTVHTWESEQDAHPHDEPGRRTSIESERDSIAAISVGDNPDA